MELLPVFIGMLGAIVCGVIAEAKKRFLPGWMLLGFFFNVLTVIVLVMLPKVEAADGRRR